MGKIRMHACALTIECATQRCPSREHADRPKKRPSEVIIGSERYLVNTPFNAFGKPMIPSVRFGTADRWPLYVHVSSC